MKDHPGRATLDNPNGLASAGATGPRSLKWYVDLFKKYPSLLGLEGVNGMDNYGTDRAFWDNILINTMPGRPVWGFAHDDNHGGLNYGAYSFNTVYMKNKSVDDFKAALDKGQFVFSSYSTMGPNAHKMTDYQSQRTAPVPQITNIAVDETSDTITINAEHADRIEWVSFGGKVVATGNTIDLAASGASRYVRAVLTNQIDDGSGQLVDNSQTFTQPFGLTYTNEPADSTIASAVLSSRNKPLLSSIKSDPLNNKVWLKIEAAINYGVPINIADTQIEYFTDNNSLLSIDPVSGAVTLKADVQQNYTANVWAKVTYRDGHTVTTGKFPINVVIYPKTSFIERRSPDWKYLDNGSDQGSAWYSKDFDDSSWKTGSAPLGYPDNNYHKPSDKLYGSGWSKVRSVVDYGGNPSRKYMTTYLRKTFEIEDVTKLGESVGISIFLDDGAIVYLNGHELLRNNMPDKEETVKL